MGYLINGLILIGLSSRTLAQSDAQAIVEKAIQAHGGAEKLDRMRALKAKARGVAETPIGPVKFTQESSVLLSGKIKETSHNEVKDMKVDIVTVYDGEHGWISVNGQTRDMDDKLLTAMKDNVYRIGLARMTTLKDPSIKLAPASEAKVNDRPAVGVKISKEGQKDVTFYFDKETGLLAKIEQQSLDFTTGQDVPEERIITEYQDIDGLKTSKKGVVMRDGKKFLELEIVEAKYLDTIDDNEFRKP
jgi:hypothetical protein